MFQWNDTVYHNEYRGTRAGAWSLNTDYLMAGNLNFNSPAFEGDNFGFRVATTPEPGSAALLVGGCALLAARRRRGA